MARLAIDAPLVDKGYQQLTLTGVDTLTVPTGAWIADVQAEVQNIRFRVGSTPTTSVGTLLVVGDSPSRIVGRTALLTAEFIQAVGGAKLNVQYWGG